MHHEKLIKIKLYMILNYIDAFFDAFFNFLRIFTKFQDFKYLFVFFHVSNKLSKEMLQTAY